MKREIKFRVWNPWNKNMIYLNSDIHLIFFGGKKQIPWGLYHKDGHRIATGDEKAIFNETSILMQFTGLKDKNGKEIYEGDIINDNGLICEIKFVEGCFVKNFETGNWIILNYNKIEIIGNIYENPELL